MDSSNDSSNHSPSAFHSWPKSRLTKSIQNRAILSKRLGKIRDNIYTHPFEMVVCIMSFLGAYRVLNTIIEFHTVHVDDRTGIYSLPVGVLWVWAVMGLTGSVIILVGLWVAVVNVMGFLIELSGLWLLGSLWLSVGLSTIFISDGSFPQYGQHFTIAIGCLIRILAIHRLRVTLISVGGGTQ